MAIVWLHVNDIFGQPNRKGSSTGDNEPPELRLCGLSVIRVCGSRTTGQVDLASRSSPALTGRPRSQRTSRGVSWRRQAPLCVSRGKIRVLPARTRHYSSGNPNGADDAKPPTSLIPPVGVAFCHASAESISGFRNFVALLTSQFINLVKLCVGVSSVDELAMWQNRRDAEARARGESYLPSHVTRMFPRRKAEVLSGGSLYWVIRGEIQVRQTILDLESCIGSDAIPALPHCHGPGPGTDNPIPPPALPGLALSFA